MAIGRPAAWWGLSAALEGVEEEEAIERMKNVGKPLWGLFATAMLCCGPCVAALGYTTASMTLTGPGTNGALGNVYVGPYQGTINGVSTQIICDDFYDDSFLNESWTATVSSFSDLSHTKYGATNLTQYDQAAWLTLQLLNTSTTCPAAANCAGDIQFAIWQVFDNGGSNQPFSLLSGNNLSNARYWLQQAQSQSYTTGQFSNFSSYTPIWTPSCGGSPCPASPPQEFFAVSTPEPPEVPLLAVDLSGVCALLLLLRRYRQRHPQV